MTFSQLFCTMHICFHSSKTNFSTLISSSDRQVPTLPNDGDVTSLNPIGRGGLRWHSASLRAAPGREIPEVRALPHATNGGQSSRRIVRFFHMLRSLSAQLCRFLPVGRTQFCRMPKIQGLNTCDASSALAFGLHY